MTNSSAVPDPDWGCDHYDVSETGQGVVRVCRVFVHDLSKLATELANLVADTSWMLTLDAGTQRAYKQTVSETAALLVDIFTTHDPLSGISDDFGEVMVSLGSARALEKIFHHSTVPLAELWKPQLKQNEGFDFHSVCPTPLINFGESKYSASRNPHGLALNQIESFIAATKHLRDRPHLINVCSTESVANLDLDRFGVVAAFSLNSANPNLILANACEKAIEVAAKYRISQIFVVGVSHDTE